MEGPRGEQTRFSGTCGPRLSGMSNHSSTDLVRGFGQGGGGGLACILGPSSPLRASWLSAAAAAGHWPPPRGLGFLTALWRL